MTADPRRSPDQLQQLHTVLDWQRGVVRWVGLPADLLDYEIENPEPVTLHEIRS